MRSNQFCIVCDTNKENIPENAFRNPLLFNFPKCNLRKLKWIQILQLEKHKIVTRAEVCGGHFPEGQFGRGKTYLKRDALPEPLSITVKKLKAPHSPLKIVQTTQIKIAPRLAIPFQKASIDQIPSSPCRVQVTTSPILLPRYLPVSTQKLPCILPKEPVNRNTSHKSISRSKQQMKKKIKWAQDKLKEHKRRVDIDKTFRSNTTFLKLIQSQIKRYTQRKKKKYDSFEKTLALSLYYSCGKTGYRQILRLGMKLPAVDTVIGWVQEFKLAPGINDNLFRCIQRLTQDKPKMNKDCIIAWDEMSLKEFIEYNKYTDSFEGVVDYGKERSLSPANEVLVLMVHGIHSRWKFPISFYFSSNATTSDILANIVLENITKLFEIGLRVRLGVCDMSFTNQSLYRKWGINPENPVMNVNENTIVFVHDTPHLFKLVRNNLEKRDFLWEDTIEGTVVKRKVSWNHIRSFYQHDNQVASRLAPKLTKAHIFLRDYSKMKVKLAVQLLSFSVACGIKALCVKKVMPVNAVGTSEFIEKMDEIFDFLNTSKYRDKKLNRSAFYFFQNLQKCDEYIKFVNSISIPNLKRKPEFLNGLLQTLNGIKILGSQLQQEGYNFVLTRFLQQDCLEHFFSNIRSKGGYCRNPTARQFRLNFRYLFFTSLMSFPSNGNVQDVFEKKILNFDIAFPFQKIRDTILSSPNSDNLDNDERTEQNFYTVKMSKQFDIHKEQDNMVAPYLGAASIRAVATLKKCQRCMKMLISKNELSNSTVNNLLVDLKQIDSCLTGLVYLSNEDGFMFNQVNSNFIIYASESLQASGKGILEGIFLKCLQLKPVSEWLQGECSIHRKYILKYFLRAKIFRLLKDKNEASRKIKSWDQNRRQLRNQ